MTFQNCFKIPELKSRILFTLLLLGICRLLAWIPVPGIDASALQSYFDENAGRLARFIEEKDIERAHLVGQSLGGLVILRMLANRYSDIPGRIVCVGSPLRGSRAATILNAKSWGEHLLGARRAGRAGGRGAGRSGGRGQTVRMVLQEARLRRRDGPPPPDPGRAGPGAWRPAAY